MFLQYSVHGGGLPKELGMVGQDLSCDGGCWSGGEVLWAAARGR